MCPPPDDTLAIKVLTVLTFLAVVVLGMVVYLRSIPLVLRDVTTLECVAVEDASPEYSCTNLPDRYEVVWVEGRHRSGR